MKALFILMLAMAITPCLGQSEFNFGGRYAIDEYHNTTGFGWYLADLDEGVRVSIENNGMIFAVAKQEDVIFITAGCGYDQRLGSFDNRTGTFVIVTLPILIPKDVKVRIEAPPNGHVRFTLEPPN
ncbi:MAG: hypothetical protein IPL81_07995 [Flavobacteriales bacterium]|nr:hypothetical protein [Flavobacteriales bacterium]